jgi:hypothetical protein
MTFPLLAHSSHQNAPYHEFPLSRNREATVPPRLRPIGGILPRGRQSFWRFTLLAKRWDRSHRAHHGYGTALQPSFIIVIIIVITVIINDLFMRYF